MERELRELYLVEEVAQILRMGKRTLYEYLKDGRLKAKKIGGKWTIKEEDLREFINRP